MRTPFAWLTGLIAFLLCFPGRRPGQGRRSAQLHLFLVRRSSWDRMGCAGHPFLKTPTMDRLAAQGVRFSNMIVTISICAASRATAMFGRLMTVNVAGTTQPFTRSRNCLGRGSSSSDFSTRFGSCKTGAKCSTARRLFRRAKLMARRYSF
ncbi:MAG: sulfatase-like hydrolase/transferase [Verrucomicrobiota bacterium]